MNETILLKYINLAIGNGYSFDLKEFSKYGINDLMFPKETYIEGKYYLDKERKDINNTLNIGVSIIKGESVYKGYKSVYEIITSKEFIEAISRGKFKTGEGSETYDKIQIDSIICKQAYSIYQNKLEEFMKNILTK